MTVQAIDPTSYYRPHYPRFSDQEYRRRYALVRQHMAQHEVDCLVVAGSPAANGEAMANVHWLSNWNHTAMPGFVVFPYDAEPTLFCGLFVYVPNARQRSVIEDVRPAAGMITGNDIASRIAELGLQRGTIGLVGSFPHDVLDDLRERLPSARLVPCDEWFGELRRPRSAEELEWIRRGAEICDLAMEAMLKALRPGVTERQLKAATVSAVLEAGGTFCFQWIGSTPMSDPKMVYPSQEPSNRVIERGDLVITEISAGYEWMAGQVTRSIAVGREPPEEYASLHRLTVQLCRDMCTLLKAGALPAQVARAAEPVVQAGYALDFLAIGRPSGPSTPPILPNAPAEPFFQRPFVAYETVMLLPMPYRPGGGPGLYLGDLVLVGQEGSERLQRFPLDEFPVV